MKTETKVKSNKVIKDLIYRFKTHDIGTQAASLSFFFLQSSIPMLMVLVSVVSRVLADNVEAIYSLLDFLPSSSKDLVMKVVDTVIVNSSSASVTIITILFALWSATNGVDKLIKSINRAYGIEDKQNTIKSRLMSIIYTLIFIVLVIFILVSQIYGPSILSFIKNNILDKLSDRAFGGAFDTVMDALTSPLYRIILTLVPILLISLIFALFYRIAPNSKDDRIEFKFAFMGGVFATITIYIATFLYSFFLNNFSNQSVVYGTLAGILALFIWITIVSNVLIIGAELIDSVRENYEVKSMKEMDEFKNLSDTLRSTVDQTLGNPDKNNISESAKQKSDLRKEFRDRRFHMDSSYKNMADYSIFSRFLNTDLFNDAKSLFIYVSVADEVDTIEIIKKSLELGKKVYVPLITDEDKRIMRPVRVYNVDDLSDGIYNIPTSYSKEFEDNPDLTLVPGLGFDRAKNRVGYGGGYYDNFLNTHDTVSVGLFMSIFETDEIISDENDHKLDYIITEKEIF